MVTHKVNLYCTCTSACNKASDHRQVSKAAYFEMVILVPDSDMILLRVLPPFPNDPPNQLIVGQHLQGNHGQGFVKFPAAGGQRGTLYLAISIGICHSLGSDQMVLSLQKHN